MRKHEWIISTLFSDHNSSTGVFHCWLKSFEKRHVNIYYPKIKENVQASVTSQDYFWLRQELRESVCLCVCLSGTNLSKALNLHLSLIGLSQICPRSVSGQCQVSVRSVAGQSQVSVRSFSGHSQVSLRSVSGQSWVSLSSVSGQSWVSLCLLRQTNGA